MALREIITVGDPRLRQRSRAIKRVTPEVQALVADMIETMHDSDGIGLAAAQVGELYNIIIVELPEDEEVPGSGECYVVINPEIVKESREKEIGIEGCLSIPGYVGEVERATEVVVRGLNERGKKFRLRPRGLLARVFQHEIDHCEGVLFIDRLTAPERIWEVTEGEEELVEVEQNTSAARQAEEELAVADVPVAADVYVAPD